MRTGENGAAEVVCDDCLAGASSGLDCACPTQSPERVVRGGSSPGKRLGGVLGNRILAKMPIVSEF